MKSGRAALLTLLALGVLIAPLVSEAQQAGKVYRIGYLSPFHGIGPSEEAFRQGLRELGYIEGQNLVIEWRFSRGKVGAFSGLASEMARLNVDCIVAMGVEATRAAKRTTTTIPIVMSNADDDPVQAGLIASLKQPGGNVTGIINLGGELAGKRLQLLRETVPRATRLAILWDPASGATPGHVRGTVIAAQELGMQLQFLEVRNPDKLDEAFHAAVKGRAEALIVVAAGHINSHRARIIDLAAKTRLPTIYTGIGWVYDGGLMAYAADFNVQYRRAAGYVDQIFKGAQPADLPVEQTTRFLLGVNLKTAKVLGLTIPPSLLLRADQVIE